MRRLRIALWAAVAVALVMLGVLAAGINPLRNVTFDKLPLAASFGGPFELTTKDGTRFDSNRLAGKPYGAFFGFTNCPDICPTTLLDVSNHLRELGSSADRLNIVFITVDPERDTPEHLRTYLANFDQRIIGLTGTLKDIADVARAYRIIFEKVPTSGGYTINHSASMLLMDSRGQFSGTLSFQEPPATQLEKLKRHSQR
jgi:protein SCO1